jgi:hypothetical protein
MKSYGKDPVSLKAIAGNAPKIVKALFGHVDIESHERLLKALNEIGISNFAIDEAPDKAGKSSVEIVHASGTLDISLFPASVVDPLIIRKGIPAGEFQRQASAAACTWTDGACLDTTVVGSDEVKCDKGGKADDPKQAFDDTAAFTPEITPFDLGALEDLLQKLPSLIIPKEETGLRPGQLYDWWDELKKRFGAGAVFDAEFGKPTVYTFLSRGKIDVMVTVKLGDVEPGFKLAGDKRELGTALTFMPMDDGSTLMLPRGV